MSSWPGKYVIGLTGNIATGKSVVRKMLEHLGAYGIDADSLGHRAIAAGSPGYQPIIDLFGKWILGEGGQIDRIKLARIVFSDPDAMASLEAIVHPLVGQAIDILIRRSKHSVVVIEAIKLLESGLAAKSDALWVTYASQELQLARLMQKRAMSEDAARQRIKSQPPQDKKTAVADVIIRNNGSFEDTWKQVNLAWQDVFPSAEAEADTQELIETEVGDVTLQRARPRDAEEIAVLIKKLSNNKRRVTRDDIMAAFGEKAFLLLRVDGRPLGLVGWKVENLVARTDEVYLDNSLVFKDALGALMSEVEHASSELQCEISLLFIPEEFKRYKADFTEIGYQQRTIQALGVSAWEEAARESMPPGSMMLFKQLRQDRVLRPV